MSVTYFQMSQEKNVFVFMDRHKGRKRQNKRGNTFIIKAGLKVSGVYGSILSTSTGVLNSST